MVYLITFIEGILTFISPCLLPMLPIYFGYLEGEASNRQTLMKNAFGFVLGFTITFTTLGLFSGTIGSFLANYLKQIQIIGGILIILMGLSYMEVIHIQFFKQKTYQLPKQFNFYKSIVFGFIFSISWSPCIGTFLGSALVLAASGSSSLEGFILLLIYSVGLAIPFLLSAYLLNQLNDTFSFIKRNYGTIKVVSGILLILLGILMITGMLSKWLSVF